jgi:hypothetical protein
LPRTRRICSPQLPAGHCPRKVAAKTTPPWGIQRTACWVPLRRAPPAARLRPFARAKIPREPGSGHPRRDRDPLTVPGRCPQPPVHDWRDGLDRAAGRRVEVQPASRYGPSTEDEATPFRRLSAYAGAASARQAEGGRRQPSSPLSAALRPHSSTASADVNSSAVCSVSISGRPRELRGSRVGTARGADAETGLWATRPRRFVSC